MTTYNTSYTYERYPYKIEYEDPSGTLGGWFILWSTTKTDADNANQPVSGYAVQDQSTELIGSGDNVFSWFHRHYGHANFRVTVTALDPTTVVPFSADQLVVTTP